LVNYAINVIINGIRSRFVKKRVDAFSIDSMTMTTKNKKRVQGFRIRQRQIDATRKAKRSELSELQQFNKKAAAHGKDS
jgi:3-deoxy-D-manno-octulosonate 8-phosphate phosphatase KdsC-like HAD superfamily phosphatase